MRNVDELRLARATRLLNRLDELALNLSETRINSLEPLRGLTSLSSLGLTDATGITSLEPLKGMKVTVVGASDELLATMK
jgi:hypothetical protein